MKEIWAEIEGSRGQYFVSTLGRVKNSDGYIMKQRINNWGYACISLGGYIQRHEIKVHRLVADTFIGGKGMVYHKNGVRDDNRVENLYRKP